MIRFRTSLTLVAALALGLSLASSPARAEACASPQLEGTWVVEVSVPQPPPGFPAAFTALETYSRGCGLVTSNDISPLRALGQGTWAQEGGKRIAAAIVFHAFGPGSEPAGTIVVSHSIRLQKGGVYSGEGRAEFLAPDGSSLGTLDFTSSGERLSLP